MEKQPRIRKDGQPYGSPKTGVRMSRTAELKVHNGESLKDEEPKVKDEQSLEQQPEIKEEQQPEIPLHSENLLPVTQEKQEMTIIMPNKVQRAILIVVSLDQVGIKNSENELVDPENNTLKQITVEAKGTIDIAKIAGRIANDIHDFYMAVGSSKGIARKYGFNVNVKIEDVTNSEESSVKITSIGKMRLTNPVNIAFAVGSTILTQLEEDNAEGLLTGNFKVSEDGKLFLKKLKFTDAMLNLPMHVVKQQMNEERKKINNNIKANKEKVLAA